MDLDRTTPGASPLTGASVFPPQPAASTSQAPQQQQQHRAGPPSPTSTSQSGIADEEIDDDDDDDDDADADDEFAAITRGSTSAAGGGGGGGAFDSRPSAGPVPAGRAVAASPNPRSALRTRTSTTTTLPGSGSQSGLAHALATSMTAAFDGLPASSSISLMPTSSSGQLVAQPTSADADNGPASRLPAEILNYILRFVATDPRDLARCLRVNQQWLRCGVELLWHRPTLRTLPAFYNLLRTLQPAGEALGLKHLPVRIVVEPAGAAATADPSGAAAAAARTAARIEGGEDDEEDDEDVEDVEVNAPPTRGSTPQPNYEPASPMDLSEPAPSSSASSTSDQDFSRPSSAAKTNVTEPEDRKSVV